MEDKFHLTREENVFLARKRWPDSIYSGMRMENRNVTFPQTQTILEGANVAGVSLDDVQAILNLRDAWRFVLNTLDEPLDLAYLSSIQAKVAFREALAWGTLRTGSIGISGVGYVPPVPVAETVEAGLADLMGRERSATATALTVFCQVARGQLFWDGNKRTAMLAANRILIRAGAGILLVPDRSMAAFSSQLSAFYESGDPDELERFLYSQAVFGMEPLPPPAPTSAGLRTGAWLKRRRREQGLTQRQLAEAVGVTTSAVANIEQGQRRGSTAVWDSIERLLSG
ncbi:MAG: helix-turn-helix domain-containing protein [Propionibacteriaceae bacterium]|jgi:DNA-binding XRE family transcriptional regulator|nr:helix-turn-helix domain-containing protein [Propionibacteriaceae bacterium]